MSKKEEKTGRRRLSRNMMHAINIGVLILVIVATFVICRVLDLKTQEKRDNLLLPLSPIKAFAAATDESFVAKTGLRNLSDYLATDRDVIATMVNMAAMKTQSSNFVNADFDTRFSYAMSESYVQIMHKDAYVFVDGMYGVLLIVPATDDFLYGDAEVNVPIWTADLFQQEDGPYLQPVWIKRSYIINALLSMDALGEFCQMAAKADSVEITTDRNELYNAYGVPVHSAPGQPSIHEWARDHGYDSTKWSVYLEGFGSAAYEGSSVFNYVLQLDEGTPAISVVDEDGESAGESRNMAVFSLYGIYAVPDCLTIPESLMTAKFDETTQNWEHSLTSEEWQTLLSEIHAIYTKMCNGADLPVAETEVQDAQGE